ncbi:hypothetical protein V6N13_020242 [Hibiscus sabdariffa]
MKKRMSTSISTKAEAKRQRLFTHRFLPMFLLLSAAFFVGSAFTITDYKERILGWGSVMVLQYTRPKICETQCRAYGSEALPRGIISETSDLEMLPLWGPQNKKKPKLSKNLLAIAVGIKQKENVNKMVKKFPESDFAVMLFHYDGIVDQWKDLEWNDRAIHVSAANQTKWWFAKRFLHPDIVSEYAYIFLWDEDLGVDHFDAKRYLSIIKMEGLEISQPALDPEKSELHHPITARDKNSTVHRRTYKEIGRTKCNENSTGPPCTGFVEMMAPVFSRASWRCSWHMIQSDLVYGWGLDFQLGYCAQAISIPSTLPFHLNLKKMERKEFLFSLFQHVSYNEALFDRAIEPKKLELSILSTWFMMLFLHLEARKQTREHHLPVRLVEDLRLKNNHTLN